MSEPKKHHFLPQFYLERFQVRPRSTKYVQIYVTTKEQRPKKYCAAIHDTACTGDYHTIDLRNIPPDRAKIEKAISQAEGVHKLLLDRIVSKRKIAEEDKEELALFITLTHMRVPKFKRNIEAILRSSILSFGDLMLRHGKLPPMPKELKNLGKKSFREIVNVEISNWIILHYMFDAAVNSNFTIIIKDMELRLLSAPAGVWFITWDFPVSVYHPSYEKVRQYGVGPLNKHVQLTFPLCPDLMLLASWDAQEIEHHLSNEQVNEYNQRTVIMADKYIYSCTSNSDLSRLVSENAYRQAGFKLDELETDEGTVMINRFIPVTA